MGITLAGNLEQKLFKSHTVSEGNEGANASGEVSIKPGSFHNRQAENTASLICPAGKEL